jgi:uncharacterized protein YyaL (SSP411 family)
MAINWQPWSDELLRVARDERRPVLLFITARWSRFCGKMDRGTWSDPAVISAVAEHAIAVRVDKAEAPDIDARYGQGGWPSTVLLDGEGEVLAGGTFLEAEQVVALVAEAARRVRTEGPSFRPPHIVPTQPSGELDDTILPAIEQSLLSHFDARHGGFGTGQKFPHPEALDFAILRQAEHKNPRLHEVIEKTLTHMAEGRLHDRVEGGFFRYCAGRDWRRPHTEKRLEINAALARNYLEAGQLMQRRDFLEVGARTIEAMLAQFLDVDRRLFHASLDADDEYYALDATGRTTRRKPAADRRFLADANARAVSALMKAGAVLRRPDLTEAGANVAAEMVSTLWRPGHGMYHAEEADGRRLSGLLRDQAETARALLHVLQCTDDRRFVPAIEDLLERMTTEHVAPDGALVNREDVLSGSASRHSEAAILDGAAAAEALLRGALYTGRSTYALLAHRALALHAEDFRRHGYAMAAYGRSVELIVRPPLHIVVVGPRDDARTEALFQNASVRYLPCRVVQRLDPQQDAVQLQHLELPVPDVPTAYVFLAHDGAAEHTDPDTLWAALAAANNRRRGG